MSWHVFPWVYPVWDSLCLLDLTDYFLFHVGKFSTIISSKIFSYPFFFSSSSGTPIIRMLVLLILSQKSLRLSSVLFILFTLFSSSEVISTILSSSSLIHSSGFRYSAIDSFQSVFNFSNCVVCLCMFIL